MKTKKVDFSEKGGTYVGPEDAVIVVREVGEVHVLVQQKTSLAGELALKLAEVLEEMISELEEDEVSEKKPEDLN